MEVQGRFRSWLGVSFAGYLLVLLGISVLAGWLGNISALMTVLPGRIAMKPNTAVAFASAGLAILLLTKWSSVRQSKILAAGSAALVLVLGFITLVEYALHLDTGIDQFLFGDPFQFPYPGRMAQITAWNFCLAGLSLLLLSVSRKYALWSQILALVTGLSALVAIVGYLYGVPLLYGSIRYTSMALHTGLGFLVLAIATLYCSPDDGLISVVTSPFAGGWLCRHLIPLALLVPVVLGAICIRSRFSPANVGLAVACLMVGQAVLFVALIWSLAMLLNRSEQGKRSAHQALRESERNLEQNYRSMFEEAIIGMFQTSPAGKFLSVNPSMARNFGYASPEEMISLITDIPTQVYVDPTRRAEFKRILGETGLIRGFECQVFRKNRSTMWISANARAIQKNGAILRYDGTFEDITERKSLEDQLRQAQKMEAVGRLAGGVAHDFNNALGVIIGYTALLKENLASDPKLQRYAEQIGIAGHRAASLTRQLLAFSRKQVIQPTVLDFNAVAAEMEEMLQRLIGEDIDLVFLRDPSLGRVRADQGQVHQVLMNLVINARDAMPQGGRLCIQTANAELDETNLAGHPYAKPGRYVMLSVSDTGCGMDKQTQAQIFEPFFTTKPSSQGTGLGLSTVYGIVKQSEGYVWVYSELGKGATFKVYFPRVEAAAHALPEPDTAAVPGGSETILLVEDDKLMRELTRTCLEDGGYNVLDALDGESAIRTASQYEDPIHLLLTDVVMSGISGRELAQSLCEVRFNMRVLFMSGYTADIIAQRGILAADIALLEKPFTREALLRKVRAVLDSALLTKAASAL